MDAWEAENEKMDPQTKWEQKDANSAVQCALCVAWSERMRESSNPSGNTETWEDDAAAVELYSSASSDSV